MLWNALVLWKFSKNPSEPPQFFESENFQKPKTRPVVVNYLRIFQKNCNPLRFSESENLQKPKTEGSLILKLRKKKKTKNLEPEIINKKSKNHPKFEKGRFFDSGFLNTQSQQLLDSDFR